MMRLFYFTLLFCICFNSLNAQQWKHLSTTTNDIPLPWKSLEQTGALVGDLNNDGLNDFVLTSRKVAPAAVWYQRTDKGWLKHVIEPAMLTVEAGGVLYDIDNDGDPDLIFGGDWQSNQLWWWENPYPGIGQTWPRHLIKSGGSTQHHDQTIGKFKQDNSAQLVFWNQADKTLYLAAIPADPKQSSWKYKAIYKAGTEDEQHGSYVEGATKGDVDGDGHEDIIAGNHWFKYDKATDSFKAIRYAAAAGRIAAGKFKPGKTLQIVVSPGDGEGMARWYECKGDPQKPEDWIGHNLTYGKLLHGHSLQLADINNDGNLDIFVAEMAKWSEGQQTANNPKAGAFIFYGDGKGQFKQTMFQQGYDFHEVRIADLDNDGDMDILYKPYNLGTPRIDIWLQNGTGKALNNLSTITSKSIGLELYSFRHNFQKDVPSAMKSVTNMGFAAVEISSFYGLSPAKFKRLLTANKLAATSMLFPYELFRDSLDVVIKQAKLFNVKMVGCAWIPHNGDFTRADADKAISLFNHAGKKLNSSGLHFFYHPHGYEFKPMADSTFFAYMAAGMKKGIADFELDVFWAYHGGEDPVLLLHKYPGRFLSMHLKQMRKGEPTGIYTGLAPDESSVALNKGVLDYNAILQAALQTGVRHFYIEDESENAVEQVSETLKYLKTLH
jgi:sugar phosphate isomerase/epimerase